MNEMQNDFHPIAHPGVSKFKHPNPEQALLSALADYMFQNEVNGTLEVETFNTSCRSS